MIHDLEFFTRPAPWARAIDLYAKSEGCWADGHMSFVEVTEGTIPPATFRLTESQAQDLIDKLWQAGLRPTEGKGSAGALAATERHLEDMRTLVFKR